ncbi:MAG: hypothetical protein ABI687_09045 [Flavitalea sp.]
MKRIRNLAIFNGICCLIQVAASYLTQFKVINSRDVGEISNKYPSLFTPAGITFAIWGVIYTGLIAFSIYHIRMAYTKNEQHPANRDTSRIGALFIINNLVTTAWLIGWTNEQLLLCVILILIQLFTLIRIHLRLKIHNAHSSAISKIFTQFPLSVYLGWISIATIANISSWLNAIKWNAWNVTSINWTLTMIAIAVLITLTVINRKKNVFFGLTVVWALYGIILKRKEIDAETYQPIIIVCWAGMAFITFACLLGLVRNLMKKRLAHHA